MLPDTGTYTVCTVCVCTVCVCDECVCVVASVDTGACIRICKCVCYSKNNYYNEGLIDVRGVVAN